MGAMDEKAWRILICYYYDNNVTMMMVVSEHYFWIPYTQVVSRWYRRIEWLIHHRICDNTAVQCSIQYGPGPLVRNGGHKNSSLKFSKY